MWFELKMWIKGTFKQLGRVIHELIAVKTVAMAIITMAYLPNAAAYGLVGFVTFAILWLSFVGVRYAEKRLSLLKEAAKGT